MTDHQTLLDLLGQWVTVTHPGDERRVWHGQLASLTYSPSLTLLLPEGGVMVLPQSFTVEAAAPATGGPHPDPDSEVRPFAQLRDSGLLWLINRVAFHPRGLALALHLDEDGQAYGWSLIRSAEGEPWHFDVATDNDGYVRAEATVAAALAGLPAPAEPCTATFHDPFHGLARCTKHYPEAGDGFQHEGRSTDGSTLMWNDGQPGTAPHRPDASGPDVRTVEDDCPDLVGAVRTASVPDQSAREVTSTDAVRTPYPDTASGRSDAPVLQPCGNPRCVHPKCREDATVAEARKRLTVRSIVDAFDVSADLLQPPPCSCGQTGALLTVNHDGSHWHIPPADYEKLQQGRPDVHPAVAAWGQCWDRAEQLREELALVRQVLIADGADTDQPDAELALLLVERLGSYRARVEEATDLIGALLGQFTVPDLVGGKASVRTGYVGVRDVERWRRTLDELCDPTLRHTSGCARPDCTAIRADLATATAAYDALRARVNSADEYITAQQLVPFPFGRGDNRYRVLLNLSAWTTDPGRLHLSTTPAAT